MKIATLVLSLYFLAMAPVAHAYIDPGTGGMLVQIIVAAILGATVAGRKYLVLLSKKIFGKKAAKENEKKSDEK